MKGALLERAKTNDRATYWMRIVREIRQGKKDYEKLKPETVEKYIIQWDGKRNKYISLLDPHY